MLKELEEQGEEHSDEKDHPFDSCEVSLASRAARELALQVM